MSTAVASTIPHVKIEEGVASRGQTARSAEAPPMRSQPRPYVRPHAHFTLPLAGESRAKALSEIERDGTLITTRMSTGPISLAEAFSDGTKVYRLRDGRFVFVRRDITQEKCNGVIAYKQWNVGKCVWELHNDNGPALIAPEGIEEYWLDGQLSRNDGPARYVIHSNAMAWYSNGKHVATYLKQ